MEQNKNNKDKNENPPVDINDLLDTARKYTDKDRATSEYNINLALHASNEEDYTIKIQTQGIRSFINHKENNLNMVLLIARKFLKESRKNPDQREPLSQEVSLCFMKGLYRVSDLLSKTKTKTDDFLAAFFYYKAKNFLESNQHLQSNQELKSTIESNFIAVLDEVSKKLKNEKEKFMSKGYAFLEEIKEYFNSNKNFTHTNAPEGDRVYIVSTLWIRNLINFINRVESNNFVEKLFDRKNVCLLYFNDGSQKEEYKRNLGNYPGPVNNLPIVQTKDFWYDPEETELYTNNYLRRTIKENVDFVYVPKEIFWRINDLFGISPQFEIERRRKPNEELYELHLRRIKVLVLSDLLLESGLKNYIRPRHIQVSKDSTISDLKTKILRCLYDLLTEKSASKNNQAYSNIVNNFHDLQFEIKLFIPDINNNNEVFQIIYSYVNKFATYKIKGEEVKDDQLIAENLKMAVKDLMIIEIKCTEDKRKNFFINTLPKQDEQSDLTSVKCYNPSCEKEIKTKIPCDFCDKYLYCSEICKQSDEGHLSFHNNINKLMKKKFDLRDIISIDISELIKKNSSGGLTGLKNLGNTCFMNSALQCLSNVEELTKYFLLRKYNDEINRKNKYGSGGQIAKAYYELIKEVWEGCNSYLSPWDFRQIFVGFVRQFAGFSQHDSHEMLAFMLDALHEDLNRVKEKPYFELKEKMSEETEEQASQRWWNSHLSRENSIIVDLFHGQYKSVITCPGCERISITYDPFMYLGLPIPSGQCKVIFKYFPLNFEYSIIHYDFVINEHTTVKIIKNAILNQRMTDCDTNIEAVVTSNLGFKKLICDSSFVLPHYEHNHEIVFYETQFNANESDIVTFFALPMEFAEEKSFFGMKNKVAQPLFYVKPFSFKRNQNVNVRNLYIEIFKYYRRIMPDLKTQDGHTRSYEDFVSNIDDPEYNEDEFMSYFKTEVPFKLHIVNNIASSDNVNSGSCEFCNKSCDFFCPFNFNLDIPLEIVKNTQKIKRPFLLFVEMTNYKFCRRKLFQNFDSTAKNIFTHDDTVSIYDCLEAFRSEEKLEQDNAWYCSFCKRHQEANKKLEIYKAPNVLIVQFKRFKIKTNNVMMGMMANKKNDSLITFPINDLDLRPHVVSNVDKDDAVYELTGISQHFGSLSSGHYTALCRNKEKWYHFDDERVLKSSEGNVVTPAAYLLFYRKKSLKTKYNNNY